jgi:hypothetical protein
VAKQVNELVRKVKKEGAITADEVPGRRFGTAANPVLRLAKPQTGYLARGEQEWEQGPTRGVPLS